MSSESYLKGDFARKTETGQYTNSNSRPIYHETMAVSDFYSYSSSLTTGGISNQNEVATANDMASLMRKTESMSIAQQGGRETAVKAGLKRYGER
ncbi:hypothetical protein TWF694_010213 [Orbilia ellipsospora]|uniref:Uncharacterized protein n=1 Tax=Orbilia ellipsospora TaxID=2528407 RepID=A0AAV9XAD3_9PEZI